MRGMVPGGSPSTSCRRWTIALNAHAARKIIGHWTDALKTFALKSDLPSVTVDRRACWGGIRKEFSDRLLPLGKTVAVTFDLPRTLSV